MVNNKDTFLKQLAEKVYAKHGNKMHEICIVLPSRRAGLFFKKELATVIDNHLWMPEVLSIEEFVEKLSGFKVIDQLPLLFEFYEAYCKVSGSKAESFDLFAKWGQILLQDFNEIDRYMVDHQYLFNYIEEAKKLESWGLEPNEQPTGLVKNYLSFWKLLKAYYTQFKKQLKNKSRAYQGMAYREVAEQIENYIKEWPNKEWKHIYFAGLNALNKAEEQIIHELLKADLASIIWDADAYYINHYQHEAGYFLRKYRKKWSVFPARSTMQVNDHFTNTKKINITGAPKNIAQAKLAGEIIDKIAQSNVDLTKTAIVLADEELLLPVLHAIPKSIDKVNVTMGLPLRNIPMAALFELVINLHENAKKFQNSGNQKEYRFYYKDVNRILSHPYLQLLLGNAANNVVRQIEKENRVFSSSKQLEQLFSHSDFLLIKCIFSVWKNDMYAIVNELKILIEHLRKYFTKDVKGNSIELEYLFYFAKLFNQLEHLLKEYPFVKDIQTLHSIYKQLLSSATLPFYGEPLQGLQLMGMLETRALDFENIILLSVNESILPAGKTNNSLIPIDIKLECGMPVYTDKDAIYAYHFYRLLQRSAHTHLIYNTETDVFGSGEKSRFITQIENELPQYPGNKVEINSNLMKTLSDYKTKTHQTEIVKTPEIIQRLKEIAELGFSPSALNIYKTCKLQFYFEKVLGIKEKDEVEETIAANTLGTVVHQCLEDFYQDYIGKTITVDNIENMRSKIDEKLKTTFKKIYKYGDLYHGKNLLIVTVAKRFINNFLDKEIKELKQHHKKGESLKIHFLEEKLSAFIYSEKVDIPVKIHGDADRVDSINGFIRIIDYKTGKVKDDELRVNKIEDVIHENKLGKSFQLLMYAYMYQKMHTEVEVLNSANISFRDLQKNWLKKVQIAGDKSGLINKEILDDFETELKILIEEIFDKNVTFEHNDRTEPCRFCDPESFV